MNTNNELRLTNELLEELGFTLTEDFCELPDDKYYEKQIGHHEFLRIILGNYPDTNPNCGIARLYTMERFAVGFKTMDEVKEKLIEFTEDELDSIKPMKYNIRIPARTVNIATHLVTYSRLEALYYGLTGTRNFHKTLPFQKNKKN